MGRKRKEKKGLGISKRYAKINDGTGRGRVREEGLILDETRLGGGRYEVDRREMGYGIWAVGDGG